MPEPVLRATVADPAALSAAQVAAWDEFNRSVPALASPFLSHTYALAVRRSGVAVKVCIIEDGAGIAGFFPFQFAHAGAALLGDATPLGAHMSDYVGLIARPDVRLTPAQLLRLARLNTFLFSHLDETQLAYGLQAEQPRVGLRLRLAGDDPLAALLAQNNRYARDSERCTRLLEKDLGPLSFEFDQQEGRAALIEQLIALKREQYEKTAVPDALAAPWTRALLAELAATGSAACSGRLSTLSAGGRWLASHFGLAGHGVLHHWMPVYNPELGRYAPGRLLMHHMIAACHAQGIGMIDHGEGDSVSKRHVANEEHAYLRGEWHNRSLASVASRGVRSLQWRFQGTKT